MFRKRPLRPVRPFNRWIAGRPIYQNQFSPEIKEAHRLFDSGDFIKSGQLFLELAEKALEKGIPQAPNLFLKSAACFLRGEENEKGEQLIIRGLNLFAQRKQWRKIIISSSITINKLRDIGQQDMAKRIGNWVEGNVPDEIRQSDKWKKAGGLKPRSETKLPDKCQVCGGPVDPKEIEWFNSDAVICSFCGCGISNAT